MSASQPDECHGGVPTGGFRQDGQGEGCAAQDGTGEAELEAARRDVLAKAKAWRGVMRMIEELADGGISRPSRALAAAVDELVRIEGQR